MGGGGGSAAELTDAVVAGIVASGAGAAEGDFATSKTSVWWDIENCAVPRGCDAHVIAKNISSALADMGYKGIVSSINAYGDTAIINNAVLHALNSTGVKLHHIPAGAKDASDKKILVDMLFWAIDNPAPANILLISGDRDFSNALHQLGMRRYNILLAHAPNVSQALVAAAKCVWLWTSLLSGGQSLNTELSQSSGNNFSNASKVIPEKKQQATPSKSTQSQVNGRVDKRSKGKQACKPTSGPEIVSEQSVPHGNTSGVRSSPMQPKTTRKFVPVGPSESVSTGFASYVETNSAREAPDKPFGAGIHSTSDTMTIPVSSAGNDSGNYQRHPAQLLKPSDIRPQKPVQTTNFYGPIITSKSEPSLLECSQSSSYGDSRVILPGTNLPNIPKLSLSENNRGVKSQGLRSSTSSQHLDSISYSHQHSTSSFSNGSEFKSSPVPAPNGQFYGNGAFRMPVPPQGPLHAPTFDMHAYGGTNLRATIPLQPSNEVQFHIGNILLALNTLRTEKVLPTEENISGCIQYGEKSLPYFNVRMGLDYALRHGQIVKLSLSSSLTFYHKKDERLWECVNVTDSSKVPKATLDVVKAFLTSYTGSSSILSSKCRYQAAVIMKKLCLKDRIIGEVLQILHAVIDKKWLVPSHPNGWQPLSIKLPVPNEAQRGPVP